MINYSNNMNNFGALDVPSYMKSVKNYRQRSNSPLLIMPYGPGGKWLEQGHEGAASSSPIKDLSIELASAFGFVRRKKNSSKIVKKLDIL